MLREGNHLQQTWKSFEKWDPIISIPLIATFSILPINLVLLELETTLYSWNQNIKNISPISVSFLLSVTVKKLNTYIKYRSMVQHNKNIFFKGTLVFTYPRKYFLEERYSISPSSRLRHVTVTTFTIYSHLQRHIREFHAAS